MRELSETHFGVYTTTNVELLRSWNEKKRNGNYNVELTEIAAAVTCSKGGAF